MAVLSAHSGMTVTRVPRRREEAASGLLDPSTGTSGQVSQDDPADSAENLSETDENSQPAPAPAPEPAPAKASKAGGKKPAHVKKRAANKTKEK